MGSAKKKIQVKEAKINFTYQTKNLINGKTYIGVHSADNLNDGYLGSGHRLLQSIAKHGASNFKMEPLCFFNTKEEAYEEESWLVNEAWVRDRNNYNVALGGSGGRILIDHNDYVKAQSTAMPGVIDGEYYLSVRQAMKATGKSREWCRNRMDGSYRSPEYHKKKKQKLFGHAVEYRGVEYPSVREAMRQTGISRYLIRKEARPL